MVTVAVYNASGEQVAETTAAQTATLLLQGLSAGQYTIVLSPPAGSTATFEMAVTPPEAGSGVPAGDGPVPLWAYAALAAVLLIAIKKKETAS